eukprot:CAMPEP_0119004654 /NCGR_PEP_ID=MMETSP1176-20130426/1273_1 /TAXON_ID=265551 /ORGANISM="Synedropsis recta cf, Strain CCMP1620" /LENGTH=336 /DNA_ID=CAMNT_0006956389 /DNA_START=57 /DNA_END=1064 /DNA_ORIENTATION=-
MQKPLQKIGEVQLIDCGTHGRQRSRSVSWNSTGSWLAWASSDRMAKIWSIEGGSPREVVAISGHTGPVDRVRFHPTDPNVLCTAAQDRTIRLWDLRGGSQRMTQKWDITAPARFGNGPATAEWTPSGCLVVAERNDTIHIYDPRKTGRSTKAGGGALKSIDLKPNRVEGCQLSPNGEYLVASTTVRGEGMGELRMWRYEDDTPDDCFVYPGHTGAIYQFAFSPDGTRLATGGSDAIVGLWDTKDMVCTHTITRRTKFIRSVSFSHDSQYVASSTEEDGIDIASADDGSWAGTISFGRRGAGGADEIAYHPKKPHILACARGNTEFGNPPAVTVAKW